MRYSILIVAALMLVGCAKHERSSLMHEDGKIEQVSFTPATHGSGTSVGVNSNGGVSVGPVFVNTPEVYTVVVECQHGKFITNRPELWRKLKAGQIVDITYQEVYEIVNIDQRKLVDLHLVDINPKVP